MPFTQTSLSYPESSIELFQKLRHLPLPILLSSGSESGSTESRFDILSAAPEKILRTDKGITTIEALDGSIIREKGNPIELLKQQFEEKGYGLQKDENLPFTGGALGYFGYELLHEQFSIKTDVHSEDPDIADMVVGIYQWALIIDHKLQRCTLVVRPECSLEASELVKCLSSSVSKSFGGFKLSSPFKSNFSYEQYQQAYNKVIDYIHAGDCYQVNLTQRFSASCEGDPLEAFDTLQKVANAPFSAFIEDGFNAVLSFSPERFLKVSDKSVLTQPIKGTRPRDSDPEQDKANLDELNNSSKDKAENLMIVDLLRNDLGRVCKTGSVTVQALFEPHSFTNVHHLISTIKGELNEASEIFELLEAGFPGGSITGTPKIRSMEIINELETRQRSVYCGSVAYIDFNGDMDSSICIRTLVSDGKNIHCWGGGAVVADSTVEQEYQETFDKISIFMNGLES